MLGGRLASHTTIMALAPHRPDRIDPLLSRRLACARVLCILGMIWVHVPGAALDGAGRALDPEALGASLQALLVEGPGRAGAALLSVISGWLCAQTLLGGQPAASMIRARLRTVLVPMLSWGGVTVGFYAVVSLLQPTFLSVRGPIDGAVILHWINSVAFLTDAPMGPTLHLSFMRDLFVCAALSPWLLAGLRRAPLVVVSVTGALYLADVSSVIVLRPLVLFAFSLGLWLRASGADPRALDARPGLWVALAGIVTLAIVLANGGAFAGADALLARVGMDLRESVLYPANRVFGSLAVWTLTLRLAKGGTGERVAAAMPWIFTAYCSHFLVLGILWAAFLEPAGLGRHELGFTLWFLAAPLLALGIARAIVLVLRAHAPDAIADAFGPARAGKRVPDRPGARTRRARTVSPETRTATGVPSVPPVADTPSGIRPARRRQLRDARQRQRERPVNPA